jgi:hypothetical protein
MTFQDYQYGRIQESAQDSIRNKGIVEFYLLSVVV